MSSYSSLLSSNSSENDQLDDAFELDDYLNFNEELQEGYPMAPPASQQNQLQPMTTTGHSEKSDGIGNRKY